MTTPNTNRAKELLAEASEEGSPHKAWSALAHHMVNHAAEYIAAVEAVERVRALHYPNVTQVVTGDCAVQECYHEDECPTVDFKMCAACDGLAELANPYYAEDSIGIVAYPCPTIRALDGAHNQPKEGK